MSKSINQPIYYVPYAEILEDFNFCGIIVKKGETYPISDDTCSINFNKKEVKIMVQQPYSCNIIPLPEKNVKLFVNKLIPKFNLGDVVVRPDTKSPFRVAQHCIVQGKIWYRNCWSISTGCENGQHEENLRLAPELKDSWEIEYGDNLLKDSHKSLYSSIVLN